MSNNLGKIHVYTGNGKGKTTAAVGLAVRAAGAGLRVGLIQFMKARPSAEVKVLKTIPGITVHCFGGKKFIYKKGAKIDKTEVAKALALAKKIINSKKYDLTILDEVGVAQYFKLLTCRQLIDLIKSKPADLELVITGRKVAPAIVKLADYVTEMKEIKHPYRTGLLARKGVEY